ncbi:MAG: hypothetical protein ACI9VM_000528 [Candidatus Azotimanducaceae bacterium]|jgi:hypothetical protein
MRNVLAAIVLCCASTSTLAQPEKVDATIQGAAEIVAAEMGVPKATVIAIMTLYEMADSSPDEVHKKDLMTTAKETLAAAILIKKIQALMAKPSDDILAEARGLISVGSDTAEMLLDALTRTIAHSNAPAIGRALWVMEDLVLQMSSLKTLAGPGKQPN